MAERAQARNLFVAGDAPLRRGRLVGSVDELSMEQLLCRDLRHAWVFKGDGNFVYYRRKLVRITRTLRCDRGCGCERDEELLVPSFERDGKPIIRYPSGYQIRGGGVVTEDFRREYYKRLGKLT